MHKRPGNAVSPSGLCPFLAVSRNAFRPGEPRNGPESHFFFKDPIFIWEKGTLGALSLPGALLLLGEVPKVNAPFRPPGARKRPETACFGRVAGKIVMNRAISNHSSNFGDSALFESKGTFMNPFLFCSVKSNVVIFHFLETIFFKAQTMSGGRMMRQKS